MQSWLIDPVKKDYVLKSGRPVETDSLQVPAYIRIKTRRTRWMYAPDTDYGSDFYLIKKRRSTADASIFENTAAKALQPIVDDGRSSGISVTTQVLTRGGVGMSIDITDARGQSQETQIVPIT
jgi:phage gp46-like protein